MISIFVSFYLSAPGFDVSELESLFSATVPKPADAGGKSGARRKSVGSKTEKVHLVIWYNVDGIEIQFLIFFFFFFIFVEKGGGGVPANDMMSDFFVST